MVAVLLLKVIMGFVWVEVGSISSFKRLRAGGSQVLAPLMLFLSVILHTVWSGKSLQL